MRIYLFILMVGVLFASCPTFAAESSCNDLPSYASLKSTLTSARHSDNGGLDNDMWGAIIARDGTVCSVAYTGSTIGSQWPGSRAIAMSKANTANSFSLDAMSLSTANLYAGSQPGGFLFGIGSSNPVDTSTMYAGPFSSYGTEADPMVGKRASGIIVFGGGLALYDNHGFLIGAIGVSGDTSCADHNIAWRTRNELKLDFVPKGVASDKSDNIIYDISLGKSSSGYGHPSCGNHEDKVAKALPVVEKQSR